MIQNGPPTAGAPIPPGVPFFIIPLYFSQKMIETIYEHPQSSPFQERVSN